MKKNKIEAGNAGLMLYTLADEWMNAMKAITLNKMTKKAQADLTRNLEKTLVETMSILNVPADPGCTEKLLEKCMAIMTAVLDSITDHGVCIPEAAARFKNSPGAYRRCCAIRKKSPGTEKEALVNRILSPKSPEYGLSEKRAAMILRLAFDDEYIPEPLTNPAYDDEQAELAYYAAEYWGLIEARHNKKLPITPGYAPNAILAAAKACVHLSEQGEDPFETLLLWINEKWKFEEQIRAAGELILSLPDGSALKHAFPGIDENCPAAVMHETAKALRCDSQIFTPAPVPIDVFNVFKKKYAGLNPRLEHALYAYNSHYGDPKLMDHYEKAKRDFGLDGDLLALKLENETLRRQIRQMKEARR